MLVGWALPWRRCRIPENRFPGKAINVLVGAGFLTEHRQVTDRGMVLIKEKPHAAAFLLRDVFY